MKRILCSALAALMLLTLCACNKNPPDVTPTQEPAATERPLTELDRWALTVESRYNMDYEDFSQYWSLICDNYFGDDLTELLKILSDCRGLEFSIEKYNSEISEKRSDYAKKYGKDWHFEYVSCETEPLEERANEDFAAELENLYDRICVLTDEAARWSDSSWSYFAEGLGCDTDTARQVVSLYSAMGEKCHEAKVEDACSVSVKLDYKGSELSYDTWLYKVNGVYVSQQLIDNALAFINLIY